MREADHPLIKIIAPYGDHRRGGYVKTVPSFAVLASAALALGGCTWPQRTDPPQVTLVGVEPGASQGLEVRMELKLRVLNPNDAPIDFNGIYVQLDLLDKSFASGASNQSGTVPAFGETVVTVPVSVSVLGVARQAMGLFGGQGTGKITYAMHGKLSSTTSGALRFKSQGELNLAGLTTGGS
jgi:LEA14-like dessication related protein